MRVFIFLMLLGTSGFAASPDAGCFDNLCGMETACSCHYVFTPEYQGQARCYANTQQCEIDRACCSKKSCKGSPRVGDLCTDVVIKAVRKDGGT